MKYLTIGLILLAAAGLWYAWDSSLTGPADTRSAYPDAAPRDPDENSSATDDAPASDENFIEEGMTVPPDSEEALEDVKVRITADEETPEMRARLLGEFFENNANKQEVFDLTSEVLQTNPPPVLFEKALYTHAAFLNRNEQHNLHNELVKKNSDPKIRKILDKFAAKFDFSQSQE